MGHYVPIPSAASPSGRRCAPAGRARDSGLLNQVKLLRKAGAVSLQVLMIKPAPGSKLYASTYETGQVFQSVGATPVLPHMFDGNLVIASNATHP